MTPSPSAGASHSFGKLIGAASLAVVAGLYASGYFFLWAVKSEPIQASPLTTIRYWYHYGDRDDVRRPLLWSSGAGFGLVLLTGLVFFIPRSRPLHGDARFARRHEVKTAGLFGDNGIILGRLGARYLTLGGQQGVMLAAPPRSGKGVGVVVPNLLNWPGSVVCTDVKKENWTITAGFRAIHGQHVFLFDPLSEDGRTARWNPFDYVSGDRNKRINDIQRIADMLYPDPPGVDPFWSASARTLFVGIGLYLFETPSMARTLGEVLRHGMASDDEGFAKHWKRIVEGRMSGSRPLSNQCVRALYDVIDLAPQTQSSIRKTFTSRLDLWLNPMLDAATASSDFDFRELRKKPMSIYVAVNPDDLHRLRPVLSLFFQQAIGLQTRELPEHNQALRYQVLMLLDEFPAMGRIPIIAEAIGYLPGYNVRTLLVIQTPSQLRDVYGQNGAETMVKTLAARIVYAPKDFSDAREISDELGTTTVKSKSVNKPMWGAGKQRSTSESDQRRALMLPQEVKDMGVGRAIIFYEGLRPILCEKIRYFADKRFKARLSSPPVVARIAADKGVYGQPDELPATPSEAAPVNAPAARAPETTPAMTTRPVTAADIANLDSLDLDDFSVNFDDVEIPRGRQLTDDELRKAVDSLLASIDD